MSHLPVMHGATIASMAEMYSAAIFNLLGPVVDVPKPQNATHAQSQVVLENVTAPHSQTVREDPYKSSTFIGHSLWLVPFGDAFEAYHDIIGETANELDTFHFIPHITLVAALMDPIEDIVIKTHELAAQLNPYSFEFEKISQKDAYFQCVFAKMKLTEDVVHANQVAREVFPEKQKDPPYMPHLSLIYGDLSYEKKRDRLIPELREEVLDGGEATLTVPVDSIEIWSTQGDVRDWYLVERIPMKGVTDNELIGG